LQTDGYVRQRVSLQSAGQDNLSRISLGNGVRLAEIERLYDQFAEQNLQRASSDLKGQETLLAQLQSLQDSIGSSDSGLHGALQTFFDSARALEAAPAAAGARAGFLAAADGVSARMRGLGRAVQSLEANTRTQVEQGVAELNSYLQEIAQLNRELLKRSNSAEQPMQLLDQRDATLKKISELMGITVKTTTGGAASIYAGDSAAGVALVENAETHVVSAQFDPVDYGRVQFVLDAASRPTVLPTVRNGSLGGLVTFRSQSLGVAADTLDNLALGFGRGVNRLHREGLDAQGIPGGDLFYVGPKFNVEGNANAGTGRLGVEVAHADRVQAHSYKMSFDANAQMWTLRDQTNGQAVSGENDLVLGGLKFSVQGLPKNGDTFIVTPESRPSLTFQTLIRDPEKSRPRVKRPLPLHRLM
jgi:flagellar hook-associated protein 1 FlgK